MSTRSSIIAGVVVLAALSCRDDTNAPDDARSPTEPALGAAAATLPAHTAGVRLITAGGTY
ncbi:MAG TPA: hypothetical protein VF061_02040, partial [Gemmatimonadales bacterium]